MKRLSFLLAGMIAGIAGLMAEQPMWSVSGTVFDFEEEAVAGAMIFAKVDTVSIGSSSDKDGNFFLEFPPADSLCIKAVMTGYKPKEEKIMIAGKSTEIDIVFDERSTKLEEVTVSCENAFVSDNGIKFYPTGYQKSASDDAYSLLNSMQLPGFDIDRHTGAANTRSGSVSYFIDGHPASDEELRSLRPKDVLRVEYYEYPLMQFNMMPNVINYVMKKYDYGGYTTFSGRQSFLNENGDYRTSIRYDKKRCHIQLYSTVIIRTTPAQVSIPRRITGYTAFPRRDMTSAAPMNILPGHSATMICRHCYCYNTNRTNSMHSLLPDFLMIKEKIPALGFRDIRHRCTRIHRQTTTIQAKVPILHGTDTSE